MVVKEGIYIGSDTGGTMTDIFVVDKNGDFAVGKASTTPRDLSVGYWESLKDAFEQWGIDLDKQAQEVFSNTILSVYSGTTMLNALLTRSSSQIGLIITRGHEHSLMHERAFQIHAGYGYSDKSHKVTHCHNEPFIPLKQIRGVTERIGPTGEVFIPLYEHEVIQAAEELLEKKITGIAILFLCSYANPAHERRAAEIVKEVMGKKGKQLPLFLSSELAPIMREVSRLNCLVLEGMGAQPVRNQLHGIETLLQSKGFKYPLQVVLADGGIANIRYPALHRACFSGPIGGLLGMKYLSHEFDMPNIVSSDLGGTSFDVGLVMGGELLMLREVETGRQLLNIPTLFMDSIGAGAGMYLRINPESKRLDIGPGSAGADPGPVFYNIGNETPTVIDCALIMGILNPDYYLGGKVKVYKDLAFKAIKEKCSDVLGIDPYIFSEMVLELINTRMREHIKSVVTVKGFALDDYYLISFGGAGPLFMAGYSEGLPFKGIFTVPWAAAFSAFGCTTADFLHRYQRSCLIEIPPDSSNQQKTSAGILLNRIWTDLEETAAREMAEEGFERKEIMFEQIAYLRYSGQLEDLEIIAPTKRIDSPQDMEKLIAAFEDKYSRVYAYGARHAEAGYQMFEAGIRASVPKPKPKITKYPLSTILPSPEAYKGYRKVFNQGKWKTAKLYEMDVLNPGNEIEGLAIIEASATTLPIPEGKKIVIDEYKRFWLKEA
ncbi:hydantoinase/oxoprolinase family protein [Chloroflexota bacterium]